MSAQVKPELTLWHACECEGYSKPAKFDPEELIGHMHATHLMPFSDATKYVRKLAMAAWSNRDLL